MHMLTLKVAAVTILTWATGCAFAESEGISPFGAGGAAALEDATVQVSNEGLATVAIYSRTDKVRIGTVMPGQTECLDLRNHDQMDQLIARPVGGGEQTVSPEFTPGGGDGWSWTLGNLPMFDRMTLESAPRCEA